MRRPLHAVYITTRASLSRLHSPMPSTKKPARVSPAKHHAQIEHISLLGVRERMGPLGLHMYANSFLAAASALPQPAVTFDPVRPYLVCHAIELGLKAFLSLQGLEMIELAESSFGHNLTFTLKKAEASNLKTIVPLSNAHCAAIRLASVYYSGKVFEYPAVGEAMLAYPSMPPLDTLFDAASILVQALHQPCREAK